MAQKIEQREADARGPASVPGDDTGTKTISSGRASEGMAAGHTLRTQEPKELSVNYPKEFEVSVDAWGDSPFSGPGRIPACQGFSNLSVHLKHLAGL